MDGRKDNHRMDEEIDSWKIYWVNISLYGRIIASGPGPNDSLKLVIFIKFISKYSNIIVENVLFVVFFFLFDMLQSLVCRYVVILFSKWVMSRSRIIMRCNYFKGSLWVWVMAFTESNMSSFVLCPYYTWMSGIYIFDRLLFLVWPIEYAYKRCFVVTLIGTNYIYSFVISHISYSFKIWRFWIIDSHIQERQI